jgi:hypothetical protein
MARTVESYKVFGEDAATAPGSGGGESSWGDLIGKPFTTVDDGTGGTLSTASDELAVAQEGIGTTEIAAGAVTHTEIAEISLTGAPSDGTSNANDILVVDAASGDYTDTQLNAALSQAGLVETGGSAFDDTNPLLAEDEIDSRIDTATTDILSDLLDVDSAAQLDGNVIASDGGNYAQEGISSLVGDHVSLSDLSSAAHSSLSGIGADDHHTRPAGGTGISFDSTNEEYDLDAALNTLNDTSVGSPSTDQVVYWNGSNWVNISAVTPLNQGGFTASTVDANNRIVTESELDGTVSQLSDLSDVSSAAQLDGNVIASSGGDYQEEGIASLVQDHVGTGDLPSDVADLSADETITGQWFFDGWLRTGFSTGLFDKGSPAIVTDRDDDQPNTNVGVYADGLPGESSAQQLAQFGTGGDTTWIKDNLGLGGETNPSYALDVSGTAQVSNMLGTSDRREKSEIKPLMGALGKVQQIGGHTFYKGSEKRQAGVIAQEVREVLPEAVWEDNDGMLSVEPLALIGLFTEALKQLQAEVQ